MTPVPFAITARTLVSRARSLPIVAHVVRAGWLLLLLGALALATAATPALHALYRTTCPEPLCDLLPQPTADAVRLLARLGVPLGLYAGGMAAVEWCYLLLWGALGGVIVWKRPRDGAAVALAYGGLVVGSGVFLDALAWGHPQLVLPAQVGALVTTAAAPLFVALFPDGRFVPRFTRWVALGAVGYGALFAFAGRPLPAPLAALELPLGLALWSVLLVAQVHRYRRVSNAVQRQQAKWLLFGVGLFVANVAVALGAFALGLAARYQLGILALCYGAVAGMVLAVGSAILRHRLYDVDLVLNRALVYAGLTAGVLGIYTLIVGGLGTLLQARGGLPVSLVATAVVAVAFQPLRERLQRAVNRLLYGQRDEPYAVLARLGRQLEASLAPDAMLATVVETVASALRLPYAAIVLGTGEATTVAATYGSDTPIAPVEVPLVHQGEQVGALRLAPRPGERALTRADRRLLDDLARHAGAAVHAVRLGRDLQRARAELVTAREEERRRLRRDLHDGLGPALASQALTVDTARLLLDRDPPAAAALLREAKAQSQAAVAEIRRVAHGLRPPALDDLGLVGALREEARRYAGAGVEAVVEVPEPLPSLPAAVEVAAYRIVAEALANVARHARARRCTVTLAVALAVAPALQLTVADDGVGVPTGRRAGVGLASMRERAEELGGRLAVEPNPGGGAKVVAWLPVA